MEFTKNKKIIIIVIVVVVILIIFSVAAFASSKGAIPKYIPFINPKPVICDPNNKGYTMDGQFSIQCAGGTPQCDSSRPGYDEFGNLASYCGVPCDENNLGYDVNGNFSMLCG